MSTPRKMQLMMLGVVSIFTILLVIVTVKGYSRKSGSTGLDVVKIHQMRQQS